MANLFKKSIEKAVEKPKVKKDERLYINIEDESFFNKVQQLDVLNKRLKKDKADADKISDEIKLIAKSEWINLYIKMRENPGSVIVESSIDDDISQVMFIPQDRYASITEDKAELLIEKYGNGIVETTTTFTIDPVMVERYGEILSKLIMDSSDILEIDKQNIIKLTEKISISKGSIDNMDKLGSIDQVMEDIKPVISLASIEIIKG